jgi:hypothetical protein
MAEGGGPERDANAKRIIARTRAWVRAIHRDLGYLAVGLTVVYALSGLAVNHVGDWDSNFESYQKQIDLGGPIAGDDQAIARTVFEKLGVSGEARDVYRESATAITITLDKRTLHVDPSSGHVLDEGQRPRFFLRAANWLHLNRGKRAWTRIADLYAGGLLLLALSGMFMLPGKKGLIGRGAILVLLGALVPILYVTLSGGPGGH